MVRRQCEALGIPAAEIPTVETSFYTRRYGRDEKADLQAHVRPTRRLSRRGFRAWLVDPGTGAELARCDCGWAPELGRHYRVKNVGAARQDSP